MKVHLGSVNLFKNFLGFMNRMLINDYYQTYFQEFSYYCIPSYSVHYTLIIMKPRVTVTTMEFSLDKYEGRILVVFMINVIS